VLNQAKRRRNEFFAVFFWYDSDNRWEAGASASALLHDCRGCRSKVQLGWLKREVTGVEWVAAGKLASSRWPMTNDQWAPTISVRSL
jgi:hypothetical protein